MRTLDDLRQLQALPLPLKVDMTKARIRQWVQEFGEDGVYVSFSGGKDSTVLLHIARSMYPNVVAMFVDTGLEYPEIREFVKSFENVDIVKPRMTFKKVIEKEGYPFISKEIAKNVRIARRFVRNPELYEGRKPLPVQEEGEKYEPLAYIKLRGKLKTSRGKRSLFNCEKWEFMLKAPFELSEKCCNIMKKAPAAKYEKMTGKKPMLATMAVESRLRAAAWLKNGCNAFKADHQVSTPMAFWTEQDVLQYIYEQKIEIVDVYGDLIVESEENDGAEGQMIMEDCFNGLRKFRLTGLTRTGCMFCGFGCTQEKESRFRMMKQTHPKQYEWIMKPWAEGGLGYKEVIDWINENNGDGKKLIEY